MSHDVYAATGESRNIGFQPVRHAVVLACVFRAAAACGALGDRALFFAFCSQGVLDFAQRQTIHDVLFGEPAFARDADAEPQILQTLGAMSVWIDHTFNAFLFR